MLKLTEFEKLHYKELIQQKIKETFPFFLPLVVRVQEGKDICDNCDKALTKFVALYGLLPDKRWLKSEEAIIEFLEEPVIYLKVVCPECAVSKYIRFIDPIYYYTIYESFPEVAKSSDFIEAVKFWQPDKLYWQGVKMKLVFALAGYELDFKLTHNKSRTREGFQITVSALDIFLHYRRDYAHLVFEGLVSCARENNYWGNEILEFLLS